MEQIKKGINPAAPHMLNMIRQCLQLGKFRLSAMVTFTTLVGYLINPGAQMQVSRLSLLVSGTLLIAMGANGLNQWWEQDRDARMLRTRGRPLPSGRLSPHHAFNACLLLSVSGLVLLVQLNMLTAILAAVVWFCYLFLYTPLKTRSALAILAGAITGALPPIMGWAAATGEIGLPGWVLGWILYIWQIPHFLALAALYQQDYARGGYRMLPDDPQNEYATRGIIVVFSAALLVISILAPSIGLGGNIFLFCAFLGGGWLLVQAVRLYRKFTRGQARTLFITTIIYLPLIMCALLLDLLINN